jgi:hypothetical protein
VRTQYSRLILEILSDSPFVPDVVSGCEHVNFGIKKFIGDLGGDPEACGRVFDIGYAEIGPILLDNGVQFLQNQAAPRLAKDVTDE